MAKELKELLKVSTAQAKSIEKALSKIRAGEKADLSSLLGGGVNKIQKSKFAMFVGGKPVDEPTYIEAVMNRYNNSTLPLSQGIYMQEIRDLEATNPDKYQQWKASGFKTTGWSGGANTEINRRIRAQGGLESSKYSKDYEDYSAAGMLYYAGSAWSSIEANKKFIFEETIKGVHENVEEFSGVTRKKAAVHVNDTSGQAWILVGTVRPNDIQGIILFEDKEGEAYGVEAHPEPKDEILTGTIAAEGDMGHVVAESTQSILHSLKRLRALIKYEESLGSKGDSVSYLKELEKNADIVYKQAVANDKIFFETPFPSGSGRLKEAYALVLQQATLLGHNEVFVIKEVQGAQFTGAEDRVEVAFSYSSGVVVSEFRNPNQNWKGARSRVLLSNLRKLLQGIAAEELAVAPFIENSSSPLAMSILKTLDRIFGTSNFTDAIRKTKKNKKRQKSKKIKRIRLDTKKLDAAKKKSDREIRKKKSAISKAIRNQKIPYAPRMTGRAKGLDVLAMLNADIESAVIEQMVSPSLVNRTGRFARSVKIVLAEERSIRYTYQRAPYSVFSVSEGKRPWATRERDPNTIIKTAINKTVQAKYGSYFKNPALLEA